MMRATRERIPVVYRHHEVSSALNQRTRFRERVLRARTDHTLGRMQPLREILNNGSRVGERSLPASSPPRGMSPSINLAARGLSPSGGRGSAAPSLVARLPSRLTTERSGFGREARRPVKCSQHCVERRIGQRHRLAGKQFSGTYTVALAGMATGDRDRLPSVGLMFSDPERQVGSSQRQLTPLRGTLADRTAPRPMRAISQNPWPFCRWSRLPVRCTPSRSPLTLHTDPAPCWCQAWPAPP